MTDVNNKKPLCPFCMNWDPRPEDGLGPRVAYCIAKDIITGYVYECQYYEQVTDEKRIARNRELYGVIPDEEGGADE